MQAEDMSLESETNGFIFTLITVARASTFSFTCSLSITGARLGELEHFIMTSKHNSLFLQKGTLSLSVKTDCKKNTLKRYFQRKGISALLVRHEEICKINEELFLNTITLLNTQLLSLTKTLTHYLRFNLSSTQEKLF